MKDFMMIWNRFTGRRYSTVNTNQNQSDSSESDEMTISQKTNTIRRKSSVVVNRLFNAALSPVHPTGTEKCPKNIFLLMGLGLFSLLFGCVFLVFEPYELLFKLKVTFGPGGEIFEMWRKPDVELYLKVYLFNVTNHEEYMSGKASKLNFQETGPYVYKESFEHKDVEFNPNGTVTANVYHPLQYVPEMSNGTEEDIMILPNIALLSITNVMKDSSYLTRLGLNMLIHQTDTQPLVRMTAREFMFGYESTLLTLGNKVMPTWIKFDKLGLIDRMYDFDGDYETVYTGETDVRLSGLIEKYNGDVNLPQWTGKCANVNGSSDGVKFPGYIQPNDTVLFFRKSLCRSAHMVCTGEKTISGLHTYKFNFVENELDNGLHNPENKCFCRQGRCLQAGLIDVTDCYYGFPIALSYPHFYKTDPAVLEAVEGLNPRADLHESYAYVQPKSGLPVNLAFRFQINMALQDIGHMARVDKFENFVLPLLWFEIGMYKLPMSMNVRFWFYLNALPAMETVAMYSLLLAGITGIFIAVYKIVLYQTKGSLLPNISDIKNQNLQFVTNRRLSCKLNEPDIHYSSLLDSRDSESNRENTMSDIGAELSNLKEEIV
ncbi:scavenger receptor class B member 1 isoform X1 [Halictus rubicundus]|uniref:scavenger receptor class B member 1 isoform X1 n=1 Tax=Halictus rubicundus TaxID=77578 RepID=UPI0040367570